MGLSQSESARRIGVDPSTLARWERDEKQPFDDYLARVERFLAVRDMVPLRRAG